MPGLSEQSAPLVQLNFTETETMVPFQPLVMAYGTKIAKSGDNIKSISSGGANPDEAIKVMIRAMSLSRQCPRLEACCNDPVPEAQFKRLGETRQI